MYDELVKRLRTAKAVVFKADDCGLLMQAAAKKLRDAGFVVLNPAELPDGMPGDSYMPICLAMVSVADAVFLLNGWRDSPGATLERNYAQYQGKLIIEEDE